MRILKYFIYSIMTVGLLWLMSCSSGDTIAPPSDDSGELAVEIINPPTDICVEPPATSMIKVIRP